MRIGILGGGQLGRMLALAGYPLGLRFVFLDPSPAEPVAELAPVIHAPFDDERALAELAAEVDLVTFEFENVPAASIQFLEQRIRVAPGSRSLAVSQDRLEEKRCFRELGIDTPPFAAVDSRDDLDAALAVIGFPAVLKTRRHGYDGKGQTTLRSEDEVGAAWALFAGRPLLLEGFVPFDRELSVLAVRGEDGVVAVYPLVENLHGDGILRRSIAPAPNLSPALEQRAHHAIHEILESSNHVGIAALELFQVGPDLLANEIAPRVHNSGHWTIEGAECSQFENHLRAILGWPLGSTAAIGASVMINLIGGQPGEGATLPRFDTGGGHLHLYGKGARPGRKLGHITFRAGTAEAAMGGSAPLWRLVTGTPERC